MRAKLINEKFSEDSDPITDMGIGFNKKMVEELLTKVCTRFKKQWGEDIEWDKYGKNDYYLNIWSNEGLIQNIFFFMTKDRAKKLIDSETNQYTGEYPSLNFGWIIIYNDMKDNEKVLFFEPYDLKNLFKTMMKLIYYDIDEQLKRSQKELIHYARVKKYIS